MALLLKREMYNSFLYLEYLELLPNLVGCPSGRANTEISSTVWVDTVEKSLDIISFDL